uniref:Uncharacterized protein n=1 Tax=Vitis vinifera TaxID=29760 RepID=A5BVD8_VITVI|nr:hypothetical protein VITISV_036175 [Vitis vinifera]
MIRTTYPDMICYHPEWDVHECRIAWRRMSSWGIRMKLSRMGPYILHTQTVPLVQHSLVYPGRNFVRRHFTSGYLTSGWERRTLQLFRIYISGPSDNAYLQSSSLSVQCSGVLLKLPDISDRHFEIFWDIFL